MHFIVYAMLGIAILTGVAQAEEEGRVIPAATLIAEANSLDRMPVVVKGEVIGDIMPRGDMAWVNIQDESGQMSIWAPKAMLQSIVFKGEYSTRGDLIEVEGEFLRSDPALGGEMRVKAEKITIIKEGGKIDHPVSPFKKQAALTLGFLTVIVLCLQFMIKRRRK